MSNEDTYDIVYECCNCYTKFIASVPKGTKAIGNDSKCTNCGVINFIYDDAYHIHKVIGAPVLD